uniref:Uncharacterized protein n=1 Tax=Panagrolaimus sp. ES5 TaxID=591445 RepID=A0AC34GRM2_9BILA
MRMFPFSNLDDAVLRKGSMVAALQKSLLNNAVIRQARIILAKNDIDQQFMKIFGTWCLQSACHAFNAQQPRRLVERDIF